MTVAESLFPKLMECPIKPDEVHIPRILLVGKTWNANRPVDDFPVYIPIDDDSIGAYARSDGFDIKFTKIDGTTDLPYDRERFTIVSGTAKGYYFVNTDSVHTADSTWGYIYYGDADSPDLENESGAWNSNYQLVQHFEEGYDTTGSFYFHRQGPEQSF